MNLFKSKKTLSGPRKIYIPLPISNVSKFKSSIFLFLSEIYLNNFPAIDKTRRSNLDDIEYADEASNPMYECIDVDNDSMIDPLYSKVKIYSNSFVDL